MELRRENSEGCVVQAAFAAQQLVEGMQFNLANKLEDQLRKN
jgi:hypothetical protein